MEVYCLAKITHHNRLCRHLECLPGVLAERPGAATLATRSQNDYMGTHGRWLGRQQGSLASTLFELRPVAASGSRSRLSAFSLAHCLDGFLGPRQRELAASISRRNWGFSPFFRKIPTFLHGHRPCPPLILIGVIVYADHLLPMLVLIEDHDATYSPDSAGLHGRHS